MLEFVHVTGPDTGKDEATRRKVRSQAMRDFRRRQRAENERKRAASPQAKDGRTRDHAVSDAVGASHSDTSHPRLKLPRKPPRKTPQVKRSLSRTSSTTSSMHLSLLDCNDSHISTPSLHTPEIYLNSSSRQPSPALSSDHPGPRNATDVFESQAHIDQMFEFCKSYLDWLCPGVNATRAAEVLASRQDIDTCPIVLAALCLASVGHLDAVNGSRTTLDYALYKARVFHNINERMRVSTSAVSDETVGYLACLLSYEMSKGSRESILHLRGLQSIIRLKGGLNKFSKPLAMMLECLDLCHALMFDERPLLASSETLYRGDGDQHSENCLAMFRLLCNEMEDFNDMTLDGNPYKQRLMYTRQLLQDVVNVVDCLGPIPDLWKTINVPDEVAAPYRQRLEQARVMGLDPDTQTPDAHYLARIIYLRMLLMYNLDVLRIHPNHPSNQVVLDGIWDTARKISENAWAPLPYLRLWILLAGATLAQTDKRKSFFKAHLVRCVFRMGVGEWHRVKAFITRYIPSKALYMTSLSSDIRSDTSRLKNVNAAVLEQDLSWHESRHSENHLRADSIMQHDFRSASVPLEETLQGRLAPLTLSTMPAYSRQASPFVSPGLDGLDIEQLGALSMQDMAFDIQAVYSTWPNASKW